VRTTLLFLWIQSRKAPFDTEGIETRSFRFVETKISVPSQSPARHRGHRNTKPGAFTPEHHRRKAPPDTEGIETASCTRSAIASRIRKAPPDTEELRGLSPVSADSIVEDVSRRGLLVFMLPGWG